MPQSLGTFSNQIYSLIQSGIPEVLAGLEPHISLDSIFESENPSAVTVVESLIAKDGREKVLQMIGKGIFKSFHTASFVMIQFIFYRLGMTLDSPAPWFAQLKQHLPRIAKNNRDPHVLLFFLSLQYNEVEKSFFRSSQRSGTTHLPLSEEEHTVIMQKYLMHVSEHKRPTSELIKRLELIQSSETINFWKLWRIFSGKAGYDPILEAISKERFAVARHLLHFRLYCAPEFADQITIEDPTKLAAVKMPRAIGKDFFAHYCIQN